ncbi:MAG: hypothetical protein R3B90_08315 [Planctomycetaceae bacterium]
MLRTSLPCCLAASALLLVLFGMGSRSQPGAAEELLATGELRWFRGNMHTHSHWSDGDDYLESIALWYRERDYDFLVFTDHNVLANSERWVPVAKTKGGEVAFQKLLANFPDWVETRTVDGVQQVRLRRFSEVSERLSIPDEFLMIQGEEISDKHGRHPVHMNVSNVQDLILPRGGASVREVIQNNVDAVMAQREATGQPMIVHLNHPNYKYAVTAEDLAHILGEKFFEVYNGHPGVQNSGDASHPGTERLWDIVLALRLGKLDLPVMYGLAVDDGHDYHKIPSRGSEPGRGWVYVLADQLTPEAMIESLESGRFYASSGVRLSRVHSSDRKLAVEVEPAAGETYTIEFIGTLRSASLESAPGSADGESRTSGVYSEEIGSVLQTVQGTEATYEFTGDELYVRARVTSSAEHPNPSELGEFQRAWVQPVVPGSRK